MRAALVAQFGPLDGIAVVEAPLPELRPGTVRVRTTVAGVNFADVGMALGRQRRREPPFTPGVEAAGTVDAMAEDVDLPDLSLGQRLLGPHAGGVRRVCRGRRLALRTGS